MANLIEVNDQIEAAYMLDVIDDEEFALLREINRPQRALVIPYWQYEKVDLENLEDDECRADFRFEKRHIYELAHVLHLPEQILTYNRLKVDSIEGICCLLKRFAYPCRYLDMVPRFGRPVPELCVISNTVMDMIFEQWGFLLTSFNRELLNPQSLQTYANAIHAKGAPLTNCWGFVDGTVHPISRPGINQHVLYNGHKRVHAIKFQSVATPNGLVAFLHGPYEGRRHDSGILRESGLLGLLEQHSFSPDGNLMCIYGDPAYPLRSQLQAPFRDAHLEEDQELWNQRMSAVRDSVEWLFGDIVNYCKFIDFKKNLKIQLSAVGQMYIVCTILKMLETVFMKVPPQSFLN